MVSSIFDLSKGVYENISIISSTHYGVPTSINNKHTYLH